ncbi:MAG: carbamoyl phosphate synthase small subunit [Deltaproteobacteria bacterium GWA2_38_16]|nr:MAG: carbamoyl phosphate synthase small subunit [Deltaproteobacteria bacterium GWA2_38_16]OGQ02757.1 MAG: carbamoyl phosphate synthase small subunit [Deltaproteobacteria bacterium RIFCSPHIGHO2_02_FULL_38_15]OGQ58860.1 MAG: carbamoyl phosphate synthase small subunit [Deltaproteobacteria bacterium RIFCSPLOWO2_12_FULL_38_8]HBQ20571.1 carbamoyl phosphate synthase small subunit [Deltaproteobacteria bacterium]
MKALLVLENGSVFEGFSFGSLGERTGEIVFNTAMTGYQEIITDPSYKGQMVVMTYPQIGNTGINHFDDESDSIHIEGLIVKDYCDTPSSWRSEKNLHHFLQEFNVPGIFGIDTRQLTRILRTEGSLRGILSTQDLNPNQLLAKAKNIPLMTGQNLASKVTTSKIHEFKERPATLKHHVVAFDFGIKTSILKKLVLCGSRVTVVPSHTTAQDVLDLNPDGIFLSNGPGDPAAVTEMIPTLKSLIGIKPIFGICLGHQILALALGGKTHKLKFGHHGANHPVRNEKTKAIEITSQNHNFVVDISAIHKTVQVTHINLNDHTVEGFEDLDRKLFSVQYHPESSPGPHDSYYLFDQFTKLMEAQ